VPTVSGVDIALWDLAGKILNRPVCELLAGRFRDTITLYLTGTARDVMSRESCAEWAQWVREHPHGYKTLKCGGVGPGFVPPGRFEVIEVSRMLSARDLDWVRRSHENLREAVGCEFDMIVHCHNEWDLAAAVGLSQAVESIQPLWIEDPLPVWYSESWKALRQASRVRIVTGEKLELAREFLPFLSNGALDGIHPDLCFAGGISGCRKIADLAEMFYLPVATHNVGTAVQNAATAHFGASTRNFLMSETRLYERPFIHNMIEEELVVKDAELNVFDGPGLGITLVPEVLRAELKEGEPYWD
jgi:L-alanine-DL-glutamate epimerase-like enolase superfamily enzyme